MQFRVSPWRDGFIFEFRNQKMAESPLPYDSFHLNYHQIQGFVVPVGSSESKNLPAEVVAFEVA